MREIKFRAWDRNTKEMIPHTWGTYFECHINGDGQSYIVVGHIRNEPPTERHNCEVMQYTGLHDKNGKEIYEGDIVMDTQDKGIGRVEWENAWMKWNIGEVGKWAEDAPYVENYMEVIGNIYESTELLTSKQ